VFAGLACAAAIAGALFADWVLGQILSDRDRLRASYETESQIATSCLREWGASIDRVHVLSASLEEHEQIERERVCVCYQPPDLGLVAAPSSTSLLSRTIREVPR
jgi:hypothetical protein